MDKLPNEVVEIYRQHVESRERLLQHISHQLLIERTKSAFKNNNVWAHWHEVDLIELLLGIHRYSMIHSDTSLIPYNLVHGLYHKSKAVKYLTIRLLCIQLRTSDSLMEDMITKYLGSESISGSYEGIVIDYRFFSLWEYQRFKNLGFNSQSYGTSNLTIDKEDLLKNCIAVAGRLVPISVKNAVSSQNLDEVFVQTSTTSSNLANFIDAFQKDGPVLLFGESGSGKSALVEHLASKLNKSTTMVTLHLNEQSDAKTLLGFYTSSTTPGSFIWKSGVLTSAVREGRWILIEDLDRAPNEILSTLLPLIERKVLHLPARGETIKANDGFKLIATIRTSRKQSELSSYNMLGLRFWSQVLVQTPPQDELGEIISKKHPLLSQQIPQITAMYEEILNLSKSKDFISLNRPLGPRDLFKWCKRIDPLGKNTQLLDAMDCFAGHLYDEESINRILEIVIKHLHIELTEAKLLIDQRPFEITVNESESTSKVMIGRIRFPISRNTGRENRIVKPFSKNKYTLRIMERLAAAVKQNEPLLLVGETGTGKTTCIQELANLLTKRLVPFNLSQQSEGSDLLGGFKPLNLRALAIDIQSEFNDLFSGTFSRKQNFQFSELLNSALEKGNWKRACKLWRGAFEIIEKRSQDVDGREKKRLKTSIGAKASSSPMEESQFDKQWKIFLGKVQNLELRLKASPNAVAFTFIEGNLVKAMRNGDWILLDEINLAPPETLEAIFGLLSGGEGNSSPSLLLSESGKMERVIAHPDFRVFAAMNPATDVGKIDLPKGIRSRFTEIYVESPDKELDSLRHIVETYIGREDKSTVAYTAVLYRQIQGKAQSNSLIDGAGQRPHFSLRTLSRCLTFARDIAPLCGLKRALYEGFQMSFMTCLDQNSVKILAPIIIEAVFRKLNVKAELSKPLSRPNDEYEYIKHAHFWLRRGKHELQEQTHYIITDSVERNLTNLIRAVFSRRHPILIQGPTSAGKTSMIEYLARISGHHFVRVNNHEHTDLQEYLGIYVSDSNGNLKFQEGILVEALRKGHWIVLDELNLAPSDVLEALNRLLDDNRELFIPETQETIRPHKDFILFATQNPAGLYGGRKPLSRAFRNRFLEIHFDDIPVDELCTILHQRTQIPESWSRRIVDVYNELSSLRQENRVFEQHSFATLRDLFRWALRKAESVQELAINGYMLLAERVRKHEERLKVKNLIENVMSRRGPKVVISEEQIYATDSSPEFQMYDTLGTANVVWTKSMARLFTLVAHAIRNNEPVLLVGETGCGKTTVCQIIADTFGKTLHTVNAHQNTETGDLIGLQRPVRNRSAIETELRALLLSELQKIVIHLESLTPERTTEDLLSLYDKTYQESEQIMETGNHELIQSLRQRFLALFEWTDGSLVTAMRRGDFFLLDEISLADDSVLERLNSVLETDRTIFLAEKGLTDSFVRANHGFQFLATMNPGGDYGKRELSPALRNRFTEIWVPPIFDIHDIKDIAAAKLKSHDSRAVESLVNFAIWFTKTYSTFSTTALSIRDIQTSVEFINASQANDLSLNEALLHSLSMVYIDTLGANPAGLLSASNASIQSERDRCIQELNQWIPIEDVEQFKIDISNPIFMDFPESVQFSKLKIQKFSIVSFNSSFTFTARTTKVNAMRIVRALQLPKSILIEGDPGVGKTTLVSTLAQLVGKNLVRINLSEQTDLMDLFGFDAPVEGGAIGAFAWRDAAFLKALKEGDWVLLDEMNLASQSVLEGLNACLDHRGEVFIAELNQKFRKHPDFRLFAAQNPHHQGGGRKGLPASFVNRFTVVFADPFEQEDLEAICTQIYPEIGTIPTLTAFVSNIDDVVRKKHEFGAAGSPWEFNLRDTLRWLQLRHETPGLIKSASDTYLADVLFQRRFRTVEDELKIGRLSSTSFNESNQPKMLFSSMMSKQYQAGYGLLPRKTCSALYHSPFIRIPSYHVPIIEAMMICIAQSWPVILVGASGAGKSTLINHLAAVTGANLINLSLNADTDSMDLIGGYEQSDPVCLFEECRQQIVEFIEQKVVDNIINTSIDIAMHGLEALAGLKPNNVIVRPEDLVSVIKYIQSQNINSVENKIWSALDHLKAMSDQIQTTAAAQFEWKDGILTTAVQRGDWLLLDHANLCSPSVLDRLNSLLEPKGSLIIPEHPSTDGNARDIKPHPNFRIFLTMDPKYGELSSAMRNRSLELYVSSRSNPEYEFNLATAASDSLLQRFVPLMERLVQIPTDEETVEFNMALSLDHTSIIDLSKLPGLKTEISRGLIRSLHPNVMRAMNDLPVLQEGSDPLWNSNVRAVQSQFDERLGNRVQNAETLMTLHPSNNLSLASTLTASPEGLVAVKSLGQLFDRVEAFQQLSINNIRDKLSLSSKDVLKVAVISYIHESIQKLFEEMYDLEDEDYDKEVADFINFLEHIRLLLAYLRKPVGPKTLLHQITAQKFENIQQYCHKIKKVLHKRDPTLILIVEDQSKILHRFYNRKNEASGKLLSSLWKAYQDPLPETSEVFEHIKDFKFQLTRFDNLRESIVISPAMISSLSRQFNDIMNVLFQSHSMTAVSELTNGVREFLDQLEQSSEGSSKPNKSIFYREFRKLSELSSLSFALYGSLEPQMESLLENISVRAEFPILRSLAGNLKINGKISGHSYLEKISIYAEGLIDESEYDRILDSSEFVNSLRSSLKLENTIPIQDLDHFEKDIKSMANILVSPYTLLLEQEILALDKGSHELSQSIEKILENHSESKSKYLMENLEQIKDEKSGTSGDRWLLLGYALAWSYTPSELIDPLVTETLNKDFKAFELQEIIDKIKALESVETYFQSSNATYRSNHWRKRLRNLESVKPTDINRLEIRPHKADYDRLKEDFGHVLRFLTRVKELIDVTWSENASSLLKSVHPNSLTVEQQLIRSLSKLRQRLSRTCDNLQDLVKPLLGFLSILGIGLALKMRESSIKLQNSASPLPNVPQSKLDHSLSELRIAVCKKKMYNLDARIVLRECSDEFDALYTRWKVQIALSQRENDVQQSLYTFKDHEEDNEELIEQEMAEIFGLSDSSDRNKKSEIAVQSETRGLAIKLADIHESLVQDRRPDSSSIMQYYKSYIQQQQIDAKQTIFQSLPPLLLGLEKSLQNVDASNTDFETYNFYVDSNLNELKNIIALITEVRGRFRELQLAWPEHSTITDVLRICQELLQFNHQDPIAKIIPKIEKLHETVYEWQKVASKQYSASEVYDKITNLIISWRRLELSTWSKLLSFEMERCIEDAKSWWFIAYENLIHINQSTDINGIEVEDRIQNIVETLIQFLENTNLGQFATRLKLLRAFVLDVETRGNEQRNYYHALHNVLIRFDRYIPGIQISLEQQRVKLENNLKQIIQLASWKDTNIDALRESAKSSHKKLFRVIKKFRKVLQQPVLSIIEQNGPNWDEVEEACIPSVIIKPLTSDVGSRDTLLRCSQELKDFNSIKSRFRNAFETTKIMSNIYTDFQSSFDVGIILYRYSKGLSKSILGLQKETPQILKEDTKDLIKHLKVRKRALFADTLKALRQMGLQYNLPTNILTAQNSVSIVLQNAGSFAALDKFSLLKASDLSFHKILDLLPKARDLSRKHSDDLTSAEATRSIGYLEGLLHFIVTQRLAIVKSQQHVLQLASTWSTFSKVWDSRDLGLQVHSVETSLFAQCQILLSRLSPVCLYFGNLIGLVSRFGNNDYSHIVSRLQKGSVDFDALRNRMSSCQITHNFMNQQMFDVFEDCQHQLRNFKDDIDDFQNKDPVLHSMIDELQSWITLPSSNSSSITHSGITERDFRISSGTTVMDDSRHFKIEVQDNSDATVKEYFPPTNHDDVSSSISIQQFSQTIFDTVDLILSKIQTLDSDQFDIGPSSPEDPQWLIMSSNHRIRAVKAMQVANVSQYIYSCISKLELLSPKELPQGLLLLSLIRPIFLNYKRISDALFTNLSSLHQVTASLALQLTKSFIKIATDGFCSPQEAADGDANPDKLEGGTGLGDGTGAENISKDIGDDEDLTELAEQPPDEEPTEVEDEGDAVDMADADLQGQTKEVEENGEEKDKDNNEEDGDQDDIDSEVGDVDDLGPQAVDEKMWDSGERAEKDKEGDQGKGEQEKDDMAAGDQGQDQSDLEMEQPSDEPEAIDQEQSEMEKLDQNLEEKENLELPDDMEIDGQSQNGDGESDIGDFSDDSKDLQDIEPQADNANDKDDDDMSIDDGKDDDENVDPNTSNKIDENERDDDNGDQEDLAKEAGSQADEEKEDEEENIPPSEEGIQPSASETETNIADDSMDVDQNGPGTEPMDDNSRSQDQRDQRGLASENQGGQDSNSGQNLADIESPVDGQDDKDDKNDKNDKSAVGRSQNQNSAEQNAFKKLGDILEKWYNTNRQIQDTSKDDDIHDTRIDTDMTDVDFEHVADEDQDADAQALGTSTHEQARGLDMDNSEMQKAGQEQENFYENENEKQEDAELLNNEVSEEASNLEKGGFTSFINDRNRQRSRDDDNINGEADFELIDEEEDEEENSLDAGRIHIREESLEESRALWSQYESDTRKLSAVLTEQLRLILAPTLATKLRGDFRTGKRLNIKRIIPYIASSYKRDKIWMRRSVPSKRTYQVMIALDDSRSMADDENSSKVELAYKTLAMISKALAVLEVGEISILSFGESINIAHPFGKPFTDESGARVFNTFSFAQSKTDIQRLIKQATEIFSQARRSNHGPGSDLWQLLLIVSDGICDNHEEIVRLVRGAEEQRIMTVFVIVDKLKSTNDSKSIMDLQTAKFVINEKGEGKVMTWKYMDAFPFNWWLVVRDVRELPFVLSNALRQWFSEVADSTR